MACALRQSISNILGYGALFMIPAAVLGIPQEVIAILAPLHLFGQFWYHTQHIGKLGWLEYIIVTPSQHRVHHAINPIYIDKNLSAIFCVWDRMFGTFQEELDDEPPVYGVLKPVQSWNPIWINFQHLWGLALDAWHTKRWRDKFRLWLMPTGWRPEDVKTIAPKDGDYRPNPTTKICPQLQAFPRILGIVSLLRDHGVTAADALPLWGLIPFACHCHWRGFVCRHFWIHQCDGSIQMEYRI